jgi:hypothetical protein
MINLPNSPGLATRLHQNVPVISDSSQLDSAQIFTILFEEPVTGPYPVPHPAVCRDGSWLKVVGVMEHKGEVSSKNSEKYSRSTLGVSQCVRSY